MNWATPDFYNIEWWWCIIQNRFKTCRSFRCEEKGNSCSSPCSPVEDAIFNKINYITRLYSR